jgi:catechol 2,3-dioxygenase-like lactoylglutathione lyase family enzyme
MFERYTEKARRVIFFARYEASQYGSPYIESEHMLLGLLREDRALSLRYITPRARAEDLRKEIDQHCEHRSKTSTAIDLPLSNECKHVLTYAAEEAERLGHPFIDSEHLFLGILREQNSFASELLQRHGIKIDEVRKNIAENQPPVSNLHTSPPSLTIGTLGFFQLVLKVANLNASIDFYTKLGFVPAGQYGSGTAVLSDGNCILRLDQNGVADHTLCFLNPDITSTVSRLQSAGFEFERQPHTAADGSPTALLRDPDGNIISFMGPPRTASPNPPS